MGRRVCPACGGPLDLVHRKAFDRLVNVFNKVHRYQCRSTACAWEGVLQTTHRRTAKSNRRMKPWIWLAVVAISIAAALALVAYLDSRPAAEAGVEGPP